MNAVAPQPVFPLARVAAILSAVALAVIACLALVVPKFSAQPDAARAAVLFTGAWVWLSGVAGVLPVAIHGPRGVMPATWAWFAGAAFRIISGLAGLVVLIKVFQLPPAAVTVTLLALHLPMLFIETAQVVRFIRTARFADSEVIA